MAGWISEHYAKTFCDRYCDCRRCAWSRSLWPGSIGQTIVAAVTGLAALHVPQGFKVQQVAGSDLLSYPMMGTFDDRGRLFICESSGNTLNNDQMSANPDYKIRLLEDRNGDGMFDHSQVFADKLTLPAGAVWYRRQFVCCFAARSDPVRGYEWGWCRRREGSGCYRLEDVLECRKPARPILWSRWLALSHGRTARLRYQDQRWPRIQRTWVSHLASAS